MTTSSPSRVRFSPPSGFQKRIQSRVDRYFRMTGQSGRDCPAMYLKTAVFFAWAIASYVLLVFFATAWWQGVPLAISLGMATGGIGFCVMHDGGHNAYSRFRWVNRLAAMTIDLVGGSSYVWARKHNTLHHTYTNITDWDDDINAGFMGRLSPEQKWLPIHRGQHLYLWALYGLLTMKWHLVDDFVNIATGRVGSRQIVRPKGWQLAWFILGRSIFLFLALVLPALFHPFGVVLLFYVLTFFVQGVVLSVVFQMAHVVEEADFPTPDPESGRVADSWAVHQINTTVDFARDNRLLSWYVGGLNFQVEHHLFPRICHLHYPKISRIVERACRAEGIRYRANPTLRQAIRSHYRWLESMGRKPVPVPARPRRETVGAV